MKKPTNIGGGSGKEHFYYASAGKQRATVITDASLPFSVRIVLEEGLGNTSVNVDENLAMLMWAALSKLAKEEKWELAP